MRWFTLIAISLITTCSKKPWYGDLKFLGKFPNKLSEVSGIIPAKNDNFWVIEDNGNKDKLYLINKKAQLIKEVKILNGKNTDWESLAKDERGNIYIGDFGNNFNKRENLVIYKISNADDNNEGKIEAEKIRFSYPDQKKYPPEKANFNFDAEGFLYWKEHLYIFSKNRTRPYNGITNVYRLPAKKGTYVAEPVGSFVLCKEEGYCSVTGADISPKGTDIVLQSYGYLYVIKGFAEDNFNQVQVKRIFLNYESQMESVCFLNDDEIIIADEQSKTKGRNLYQFSIKKYLNPRLGDSE